MKKNRYLLITLPIVSFLLFFSAIGISIVFTFQNYSLIYWKEILSHFDKENPDFKTINITTISLFMSVVSIYFSITLSIIGNIVSRLKLSFNLFFRYIIGSRRIYFILLLLIPIAIIFINYMITFQMKRYVYLSATLILFFALLAITSFLLLSLNIDNKATILDDLADSILIIHKPEELISVMDNILLNLEGDSSRGLIFALINHNKLKNRPEILLDLLGLQTRF